MSLNGGRSDADLPGCDGTRLGAGHVRDGACKRSASMRTRPTGPTSTSQGASTAPMSPRSPSSGHSTPSFPAPGSLRSRPDTAAPPESALSRFATAGGSIMGCGNQEDAVWGRGHICRGGTRAASMSLVSPPMPVGKLTVPATAGTPGGGSSPCGRGDGEAIRCRPGGDEADPSVRRLLTERAGAA